MPDIRQRKLYSYVVEHDNGHAPNPYFGVCTLCRCKFREHRGKPKNVVELAGVGDWIVGTGGANLKRSTGHGTFVYAMRVDEKLTRKQYYLDQRFARKKPAGGPYAQMQGDNVQPNGTFARAVRSRLEALLLLRSRRRRNPQTIRDCGKTRAGVQESFPSGRHRCPYRMANEELRAGEARKAVWQRTGLGDFGPFR